MFAGATSADNAGLATTASAVGGAAVPGAASALGDAPADVPGDTLGPALTLTKAEGAASAPRAGVELATCGANGSSAPRSPLPLTNVMRGVVRPATAHGTAAPLAGRALALASRRDAGEAGDGGAAVGRTAATLAALLRATREDGGNAVALRSLPASAERDGTGSTDRLRACAPARGCCVLLFGAVVATVDADDGDRPGAGRARVVSDGVGVFASTLPAAAGSAVCDVERSASRVGAADGLVAGATSAAGAGPGAAA